MGRCEEGKVLLIEGSSWLLGEVKINMWKILQSLSTGVALSVFMKGYEGYYGSLNLGDLQCGDMVEVCRLMPDVCTLQREGGQHTIRMAISSSAQGIVTQSGKDLVLSKQSAGNSVPARLLENIRRVLIRNPGGVNLSDFHVKYLDTFGHNLELMKSGYAIISLVSLPRPVEVTILEQECLLQVAWVNVVKVVSLDLVYLQLDRMMDNVWKLEKEMEKFYTDQCAGLTVLPSSVVVGQVVAALYTDTAWYRGRVVAVEQDKSLAQIFYVDHGWTAWVRIATLRCLDEQFCDLPQQVVVVKLSGIREMKGGNKWLGKN